MDNTEILKFINSKAFKVNLDNLPPVILKFNKIMKKADLEKVPAGADKTSRSVTMYHDCSTGENYYLEKDIANVYKDKTYHLFTKRNNSTSPTFLDVDYDPAINALIFKILYFDISDVELNEKRNWRISQVFVITKDKTKFCSYTGGTFSRYNYTTNFSDSQDIWVKNAWYAVSEKNATEFHKLFDIINIGGNNYEFCSKMYSIDEFFSYVEPVKRPGKKQNYIDELTSIKLPDLTIDDLSKYDIKAPERQYDTTITISKIDKVKDGVCVLRLFYVNQHKTILFEGSRIYIEDKNIYGCRISNGEWINMRLTLNQHHYSTDYFLEFNKEDLKGTKLQYYAEIIDEVDKKLRASLVWAFITYPVTEKLYKAGLSKLLFEGLSTSWGSLSEFFERKMNISIKEDKPLTTLLGVNKYQFNKYIEYVNAKRPKKEDVNYYLLEDLKKCLNNTNIASFNNETTDIVFDACSKIRRNIYYYCSTSTFAECIGKITQLYSLKTALKMVPILASLQGKTVKVNRYGYASSMDVITVYRDYLNMVAAMNDTKNFRPSFERLEDIVEMHDAIVAIYNLKKETFKLERFKNHMSKWSKWEYADDEFSVVIPTQPEDLANEGITLHHCVKLYIDRVANGETNIVFIRKSDDLDKPFFTVEISNVGAIEQVHGFANRNANTEKGMVEFVKKWAKAKKLTCTNFNKVR